VLAFYINKMELLPIPAGFLDRVGSWLLALAIAFVGWRRANR
jgi:hypothetical protein